MKIIPKISAAKYLKDNYAMPHITKRVNKNLFFCTLKNLRGEEIGTIKQITTHRDVFTRDTVTILNIPALNISKETTSMHEFGKIGIKEKHTIKLVLAESQSIENELTGGIKKLLRRINTKYSLGATPKGRNYFLPKTDTIPVKATVEEFIPEHNRQIIG